MVWLMLVVDNQRRGHSICRIPQVDLGDVIVSIRGSLDEFSVTKRNQNTKQEKSEGKRRLDTLKTFSWLVLVS